MTLTQSKIIPCKDCARETALINASGALEVIGCNPLPGEETKPPDQRLCRITWKVLTAITSDN